MAVGINGIFQCGILFAVMNRTVKRPTLGDTMLDAIDQKRSEHERDNRRTVGYLMEKLSSIPPDTEVTFGSCTSGNPLVYYRVKDRGPGLVQIELNEVTDEYLDA